MTYQEDVQFTPHGPVAIRVVTGPRPTGLYRLEPALSNETVTGRETLTSMERRLSSQGTAVGINADYFTFSFRAEEFAQPAGRREDIFATPIGDPSYKWKVLTSVLFGLFMVVLDTTVVNIAL